MTPYTPATLTTLAMRETIYDNSWWSFCYECPTFTRQLDQQIASDLIFPARYVWFEIEVVHDLSPYTHYDDIEKENVCEEVNTWDAMLDSEGQRIWFFLLDKILKQGLYGINIPVTIHWYEKLYTENILYRFMQCETSADISNLLLMLAGDVESNPGPTYKECCKYNYVRKQQDRKFYKDKDMKRMNLNLKGKEINDDFKYITEEIKVEGSMQMLGTLGSIFTLGTGIHMTRKSSRFMDKMEDSAAKITTQLTETLTEFRNFFSKSQQLIFKGLDVISLIGDIIFGLLQVSFASPQKRLCSLGVEIFRILMKHNINTNLTDLIKTFTNTAFKRVQGQMQIEFGEGIMNGIMPSHVCIFLFTILSVLFTGVTPKATSVEILLKRIGDVSRSTKNIIDFNNATHNGMTFVLNEIKRMLGLRPQEEIEQFIVGIDKWFDEVRSLLTRVDEWKKSDQILRDPATIIEVENLYKRGLEYSREISEKKMQRDLTMAFQLHMKLLSELMKMVDTSGAFGTKPRTQPVVIWLYGESGVGKSGMSWPLAIDLNNVFMHKESEAQEFSKHIYMRNVEQEFWDNYQGQNVVIYDDFGQRVDSQQAPNEEFMELIRTANIAPYPLHMAHLEDKRKTRFTSKILLLTSNVFEQNVSSLTFPDAFRRRIDLCGKVTNVAEFTKLGFSGKTAKNVQRLDRKKVQEHFGEVISTEVYNIDLVDPESGATLERGLTYEDFLDKAIEKTKDAFDCSTKMNEFLEKYAVKRYREMNPDDKRNASMQIEEEEEESKFHEATETILASDLSFDEFVALAEKKLLQDKNGKILTPENITTDKFDEFYGLNLTTDFDTWHLKNLRETCYKRINKVYEKLLRVKNAVWPKLVEWKNSTVEWIKEHPFAIVSTVLGTLITILTVSKFWNKFFSKPKEENKLGEFTHKNVTIKLYKDQEGIDVRKFNQQGLISILPKIINDLAISGTYALIMQKPFPMVVEALSHTFKHLTIYSVDKIFNIRGRRMELQDDECTMQRMEAKPSGDQVTLQKQKVVIEAKASADPTTVSRQKVMIEAKASADPTTMAKQKVMIEATASGDPTTLQRRGKFIEIETSDMTEKVPADMQMWKDQVAQNLITNRIFSNMYKICKVKSATTVSPLLHGLFVRGTTMIVPSHLCEFLEEDDKIEIINAFDVKFEIPWKEIKQIRITNAIGQDKEATLLVFPNYIPQHCDLVKHFSTSESLSQYKRTDICLPLLRYSEKMKKLLMYILGNTQAIASDRPIIIDDREKNKDYLIRDGLSYNAPTKGGDCGAPVIVNETQVLRKIAGIHVAGDFTGTAYAESITQKDLERAFLRVPATMQIKLDLDNEVKLHSHKVPLCEEFDALSLSMTPGPKFNPVGLMTTPIYEAGKTELRKSLIHGLIDQIKTKPAKLRNYVDNDGNFINIKHKNLGKAGMDTPFLDPIMLDEAVMLTKQKWLKNMRPELRRVLNYEEAIVGTSDSEYISPINRRSSPGYPWIRQRTTGKPGKTGWFGDDEYIINKEVEEAVNYRISQAKLGVRVPTMWVDTLKDERRPIAKVDAGKTRIFSNGPMDYSIAFRQYFLGFVAHLMENRITNEVSIGTNVYSRDWTKTARKMQEKGKKVFAGDFSTFDGTLNSSMMFKFLELVNEFYDDGEENALIRYVLFSEVVNSVHICDDLIYYMTHSQPSGNPVTTPLNCFVNSVGGRMCFQIAAKQAGVNYTMYDFDRHVSLVSYGDDNIYNISDEICEWFNMHTITKAFDAIGMIYTDETKDLTKIPPKYKTLEEVSYLKRSFVQSPHGRYLAPLDMDTILEMPNWCRGGLDIQEGTKVNCENAIMELAMHPEQTFNKWKDVINKAYLSKTGDMLETKSYRGYNYEWISEYFM